MSRQFIIIPFRALDLELDGKYIKALCVLGGHTDKSGTCKIRQSLVAEILGVSRKTANEHLGVLAKAGLIEKRYTKRADGGNGAIEYRMIYDTPPVTPYGYTPCNDKKVTGPITTAVTAITSLTEFSNEVIQGEDIFEEVWKAYNHKLKPSRQGGKAKAKTLFTRQAKIYGAEKLGAALRGYYADPAQSKDGYAFASGFQVCLGAKELFVGYLNKAQSKTIEGGKSVYDKFLEEQSA